jgi:hypothetical protein
MVYIATMFAVFGVFGEVERCGRRQWMGSGEVGDGIDGWSEELSGSTFDG